MTGQYKKNVAGRLLRGLFILLLILLFGNPSAWADDRVVRVGVYENAPKVFTSESGKPSGIFIDIIEYIAKEEDWDLEYVSGTWAEGLDRLARGEIDLMPDVAFTAEREKKFSFHKIQVLSSWFQAYAAQRQRDSVDTGSEWKAHCHSGTIGSAGSFYTLQPRLWIAYHSSFPLRITKQCLRWPPEVMWMRL